jgi:hypothetical protein
MQNLQASKEKICGVARLQTRTSKSLFFKMNKHLANIIADLLRFQIKQAERHGLDSITITLPRAKQIARELRESIKEQIKPVSRLDRIFSSAEKAKFAEY